MKTVVVTCRTLEDELNAAMERCGAEYEVAWLESGLHNTPQKLTARLQEVLDGIETDRVLLAMGYCGNSLAGLQTSCETIIPRVDDCISLLLGSVERRMEVSRELAAYFFTEGWLRGERNLWVEYQYTVDKYGQELAESIMEMMYAHYRTLGILDCGIKPVEPLMEKTKEIADVLHLEQRRIEATLDYLAELLTGPWPRERYLCIPAQTVISAADLTLSCAASPLQ